jgi:hypothetical protein
MKQDLYGGYENYQTQARVLWLNNDERQYLDCKAFIESKLPDYDRTNKGFEDILDSFITWLSDYDFDRIMSTVKNGFDREIIENQMRGVNYRAVALSIIEDLYSTVKEEHNNA